MLYLRLEPTEPENAIKAFANCRDGHGNSINAIATASSYFYEAIAYHLLNDEQSANKAFQRGKEIADREVPTAQNLGQSTDWSWTDWIVEQQARKEAQEIFGTPPTASAASATKKQ